MNPDEVQFSFQIETIPIEVMGTRKPCPMLFSASGAMMDAGEAYFIGYADGLENGLIKQQPDTRCAELLLDRIMSSEAAPPIRYETAKRYIAPLTSGDFAIAFLAARLALGEDGKRQVEDAANTKDDNVLKVFYQYAAGYVEGTYRHMKTKRYQKKEPF